MEKFQTRPPNLLILVFDDEQTSLAAITDALAKGTYPIKDKPVYLKTYPEPLKEDYKY